jgi:tRNA(fMet)-specific endonuclease VapC
VTTWLLDTDIAIELPRGRNVRVVEQLASRNRNAIFLSTVTVAELMFGALRSRKSQESTVIRADLEGRGERIGAYDVLIAGTALAHGHVLATHNVREFGRVAGLQIEDWVAIP